jgi:hypothetical protein
MKSSGAHGIPPHSPALYEIRVQGALDQSWSEMLEGMTLNVTDVDGDPVTVLRVVVPDQAALAGLLDSLFRLNTTVLSVEAIEAK